MDDERSAIPGLVDVLGEVRAKAGTEEAMAMAAVERAMFGTNAVPALDRYEVGGVLGRGAFSVVYAARDPALDRRAAIKLLRQEVYGGSEDPHAAGRLQQEARALAMVNHPNVVAIYDVGTYCDGVFLVMELVRGQTLTKWMATGPRSWSEVHAVFHQAGQGLVAAHACGITHRDFKPDNVLIDAEGVVKLLDFGLARTTHGAPTLEMDTEPGAPHGLVRTQRGAILGTPAYMAPEQHRGEPADPHSDQYGFCVALYEALTGELPFPGSDMKSLAQAKADGRLLRPTAQIASHVWRALQRGLAPDRDRRFGSMRALLDALAHRPRRRGQWAGAGLGTAAIAVAFVEPPPPDRCDREQADLQQTWDGSQSRGRDAFAATGLPYAPTTWAAVRDGLDGHVAAWTEVRRAVCETAIADATVATDRAMSCLHAARQRTTEVFELLAAADPSVVEHAPQMVAGLAPPTLCRDSRWLAAREPDPADAELREAVADVRTRLRQVIVLESAGRYEDGLERAQATHDLAQRTAFAPVVAEAVLQVGILHQRLGDRIAAENALSEAALTASGAGHDSVAANAATRLTHLVGFAEERLDDGHRWARHAEAAVARLGDPRARGDLHANLGALAHRAGNYDEALEHHRQALTLRSEVLGPDHPDVAATHSGIGSALAVTGDLRGALESFERAVAIRERAFGPNHPSLAGALSNLGLVRGLVTKGREGGAQLERALQIREATLGPDHPEVANSLMNYAVRFQSKTDPDGAQSSLERALSILRRVRGDQHADVAIAEFNLGWVLQHQGSLASAETHYLRSRSIFEETFGPGAWQLRKPLEQLAQVAALRGDDERASQLRRRAERTDPKRADGQ